MLGKFDEVKLATVPHSDGDLFAAIMKERFDVKLHFSFNLKMKKQLPLQAAVCLCFQKRNLRCKSLTRWHFGALERATKDLSG